MINSDEITGLAFDRKWGDSNVDQCPARHHATVRGVEGYIVQGEPLTDEALAGLKHLNIETERAVFVPADVIEE